MVESILKLVVLLSSLAVITLAITTILHQHRLPV